jgi:hypothetical protein
VTPSIEITIVETVIITLISTAITKMIIVTIEVEVVTAIAAIRRVHTTAFKIIVVMAMVTVLVVVVGVVVVPRISNLINCWYVPQRPRRYWHCCNKTQNYNCIKRGIH